MSEIRALAASAAGAKLEAFSYDPGPLGDEQVEIEVQYCGICHSDLSMLKNEWHITKFPLVPGHEAIGTVSGRRAERETGQRGANRGAGLECRKLYGVPAVPGGRSQHVPLSGTDHRRPARRVRHSRTLSLGLGDTDPARCGFRRGGSLAVRRNHGFQSAGTARREADGTGWGLSESADWATWRCSSSISGVAT